VGMAARSWSRARYGGWAWPPGLGVAPATAGARRPDREQGPPPKTSGGHRLIDTLNEAQRAAILGHHGTEIDQASRALIDAANAGGGSWRGGGLSWSWSRAGFL